MIAVVVIGVLFVSTASTFTSALRWPGSLMGVELRVDSGDVTVVGGSQGGVTVFHSDRSAFGHGPRQRLSVSGNVLRVTSTCPKLVLGRCAASYRIGVPDNVPISIRAEAGNVKLEGYHGSADIATNAGSITVEGYCGFVLGAASASGNVSVSSACSPERLRLRSDSGDVTATVPAGNYRIEAASNGGPTITHGLNNDNGAPWAIQAQSNTGAIRLSGL